MIVVYLNNVSFFPTFLLGRIFSYILYILNSHFTKQQSKGVELLTAFYKCQFMNLLKSAHLSTESVMRLEIEATFIELGISRMQVLKV